MNFFAHRRMKKFVKHLRHEARHTRDMREDIAEPSELQALDESLTALNSAWKGGDAATIQQTADVLSESISRLQPVRPFPRIRENIEILVVAIAVAMAFRTYFIQPFKIPTGSMQPTLNGITMEPPSKFRAFDNFPLKYLNLAIFGNRPVKIRAPGSGTMRFIGNGDARDLVLGLDKLGFVKSKQMEGSYPAAIYALQGTGLRFPIPRNFEKLFKNGEAVAAGEVIAIGNMRHGDHIFVDKVRYNFMKPRRGDIIVFDTHAIDFPNIRTNTFYIKRCVGLPGETISIQPPQLLVDGEYVTEPYPFQRMLTETNAGYHGGYELATAPVQRRPALKLATDTLALGSGQYLPMGDNTLHSLDGRYFGAIEQEDLVGPAFAVYWPFGSHWGRIR